MTTEDLQQELGSILYQIGSANTESKRLILEQEYSQRVQEILQQIHDNGTA